MRHAIRRKGQGGSRGSTTRSVTMSPPIKGWLAIEPWGDKTASASNFALVLDNWFPQPGYCEVRQGHIEHATITANPAVSTLMVYQNGTSQRLFAATADKIYEVTASGPAGAAAKSSLTNGKWYWINFVVSGGPRLIACNGADDYLIFDGTTFTPGVLTGDGSGNENFISSVVAYNSRLFLIKKDSTLVYYLDVDTVQGASYSLQLGGYLKSGGTIVAGVQWTLDGGDGLNDYLGFISNMGDFILFTGTDPSSANTWSQVGVFHLPPPIGKRPFLNIGSDVAYLCTSGLLSLSKSIPLDRAALSKSSFSTNIQAAFVDQQRLTGTTYGWQVVTLPSKSMAFINVPQETSGLYHQYAYNVVTGAWCRFTGANAVNWALIQDTLYFANADGRIMQVSDVALDDGNAIEAVCLHTYSVFGAPNMHKHLKLVRPLVMSNQTISYGCWCSVDYHSDLVGELNGVLMTVRGAEWGSAIWGTDVWAGDSFLQPQWRSVSGIGYELAPGLVVSTALVPEGEAINCRYQGIGIVYETGNVL